MPWVDGQPFNCVVEDLVGDRCGLIDIADAWVEMVNALQGADVMHGDLQHGNVLVDANGSFRLVDLDGAWVPTMEVGPPAEFGHPNYQHPQRGPAQWGRHGDSFSALVVETGLRALAADPALQRFLTGENVLFGREDLANSGRPIWSAIAASSDPEVVRLGEVLGVRASENPATSMVPYGALRQGAVAAARVVVKRAPAALPDLPQPSMVPLAPLRHGGPALRPSFVWYLRRAAARARPINELFLAPIAETTHPDAEAMDVYDCAEWTIAQRRAIAASLDDVGVAWTLDGDDIIVAAVSRIRSDPIVRQVLGDDRTIRTKPCTNSATGEPSPQQPVMREPPRRENTEARNNTNTPQRPDVGRSSAVWRRGWICIRGHKVEAERTMCVYCSDKRPTDFQPPRSPGPHAASADSKAAAWTCANGHRVDAGRTICVRCGTRAHRRSR
jgi:hypothetical protein